MPTRELPWSVAPPSPGSARRLIAAALRLAGGALEVLARRLGVEDAQPAPGVAPQLEFYAEAGAPEGALYVDGQLVGRVPGVRRL